jgi:hypothetical protein
VIVIALGLERFLVERRRARKDPFTEQMIGDSRELRGRTLGIAGAQIEIAERVDRVPVARLIGRQAHVLLNRATELALPEQLLGLLERRLAIYCHSGSAAATGLDGSASIVSNRFPCGRNDRRCSGE